VLVRAAIALGAVLAVSTVAIGRAEAPAATANPLRGGVLYVATDNGALTAYQLGTWKQVGRWTGLPITDGVRGVAYWKGSLFIAHGGDGNGHAGGLLRWSLITRRVIFNRRYSSGIDQPAICLRKGSIRVYVPTGELASRGRTWRAVRESTGATVGGLRGGLGPHNTICHLGDVLMGGRQARFLYQTGGPRVGPSPSRYLGVRPFTVNATNTRVYLTWTHYRGFSVGDLRTGRILASRRFGLVPAGFKPSAPSHGISLNPGGTRLYVLDTPAHRVLVYSTTAAPRLLASIRIPDGLSGKESPCAYDCTRDGWLLTSLDGRYLFVGDSGDVISTSSHRVVARLPELLQSRHGFLEVVWAAGLPIASTGHFGIGR
jgi:hypothetical protein